MKRYRITVNGQGYDVQVEELGASSAPAAAVPAPAASASAPAAASPAAPRPSSGGGQALVKSPMPGTLMAFRCSVGQAVRKGDVILILEAMKMENEIVAPSDGTVLALRVAEGAAVSAGDILVELG